MADCTQLSYRDSTAQGISRHWSKSHQLLSSVSVGVAEVVSRGSETAGTSSSGIPLTAAMSVAVNSDTPRKRCWHSLTRVGKNLFWR